jgi:hypothetical protein
MQVADHAGLETRLGAVERRLDELERRLRSVESGVGAAAEREIARGAEEPYSAPAFDAVAALTIIGRTFVIVAGGYVFRALTEAGTIPAAAGVALGLAYAASWSVVSERTAATHPLSATFYGACTVLLGLPLVWEAATRFALITPLEAAASLAGVTALVLGLAWRRQLQALAWIATLSAGVLAGMLLVQTGEAVVFTCLFIALGIATLWLGYDREWIGPRWPMALAADAAVLGLAGRALTTPPRDRPEIVLAVDVLLLAAYLGSIAVRTLVRGREVIPFEVAQTSAMVVAGLGSAVVVAQRTGTARDGLGIALLVMAAILYAVAFAFIDRRQDRRVNFYFYTSLALVFVLTGSALVLTGAPRGVVWAGLGILAGAAARRYGRTALTIHAELYSAAGAIVTGLLAASAAGLFGPASPWPGIGPAGWAAMMAIGLVTVLALPERVAPGAPMVTRIVAWALAALVALVAGGACTVVLAAVLGGPDPSARPGLVPTVRTAVIAAAVAAIAWLGRRPRTRAFAFLLYPILAWGAVKLVIEDFRLSPPALLFVALALYGAALILGPRLARPGASGARGG